MKLNRCCSADAVEEPEPEHEHADALAAADDAAQIGLLIETGKFHQEEEARNQNPIEAETRFVVGPLFVDSPTQNRQQPEPVVFPRG